MLIIKQASVYVLHNDCQLGAHSTSMRPHDTPIHSVARTHTHTHIQPTREVCNATTNKQRTAAAIRIGTGTLQDGACISVRLCSIGGAAVLSIVAQLSCIAQVTHSVCRRVLQHG